MTESMKLAALEGWASNPAVAPAERLTAALHVIQGLRARENEKVRTAVADALRYAWVYWSSEGADGTRRVDVDYLSNAEELTRGWTIEGGYSCPFCEEATCDTDCPLAQMRDELP
jgi:hypothetical protein